MFVDESGWGRAREPAKKALLTTRQERTILWIFLANALFLLIAPIGGSTIIEAVVSVAASLR